jgi:putative endonuclease
MPNQIYYVYLLTNWNHRVLYVGVTNDLTRRLYEHQNKLVTGFTEKYNVDKLVYFEETNDVRSALSREKEIKKWRREKKDALVLAMNPEWRDLAEEGKDFSLRSK